MLFGSINYNPNRVKPLVTIRAGQRSFPDLAELWKHRDLFLFLVIRDIKIRYRQTALGVAWILVQPLASTGIFSILFGHIAGIDTQGIPYPLFVYSALLPWMFFSSSVMSASLSLVGSANLLTKIYFPRLIIPAATVSARLLDLLVASSVLIAMMVCYNTPLAPALFFAPLLLMLVFLLAFSLGAFLAAANVLYRDVGLAVPFLLQIGMFLSPVVYPIDFVPLRWRWLMALNPISGVLSALRAVMLGGIIDMPFLISSIVLTTLMAVGSVVFFKQVERSFADYV